MDEQTDAVKSIISLPTIDWRTLREAYDALDLTGIFDHYPDYEETCKVYAKVRQYTNNAMIFAL